MGKSSDLLIKYLKSQIDSGAIRKVDIQRSTGMSAAQLDAYLKKTSTPGLDAAGRLAEAVGVSLEEIIRGDAPAPRVIHHELADEIRDVIQSEFKKFIVSAPPGSKLDLLNAEMAADENLRKATEAAKGANTGLAGQALAELQGFLTSPDEEERRLASEEITHALENLRSYRAGVRGEPLNPMPSNKPPKAKG